MAFDLSLVIRSFDLQLGRRVGMFYTDRWMAADTTLRRLFFIDL